MGGVGGERQISVKSGNCVTQALKETSLNVVCSDIGPENMDIVEDDSIDVFFIALHGKFGEDGQLQQILEDKGLVYTGSGPAASNLAFDKRASKKAFAEVGLQTPAAVEFDSDADIRELEKQLERFADVYVIKPLRQGSTIGVSIVDNPREAIAAARQCQSEFGDCMIEQYISGREVTVGILGDVALPVIEIRAKAGFYDYHAKYLDEQTEYLFDTIEPELAGKIQADAIGCFNALGLRHFGRIDFVLGDNKKVYALEANTIPGMTSHSLLPKAAAKAGISMSDLYVKIIEAALGDKNNRRVLLNRTASGQT